MKGPHDVFSQVLEDYLLYYNTPFAISDHGVSAERNDLLRRDGLVYREPWIEPILEYQSSDLTLDQASSRLGTHTELAEFATLGALPAGVERLYLHQESALKASVEGKNVVITAGTGSGKTEAFLLPLLNRLLTESKHWSNAEGPPRPWWPGDSPFTPQRAHETRTAAMRAMILYPMNALVEDQLSRLRRALDGSSVREWLDLHRGRNRFYFGRYTGQTPVSGKEINKTALKNLRAYLLATDALAANATEQDEEEGREHKRYFVPRLDGAEMRSRWDMQRHPPDILITNYSMLNVMLMRKREAEIFAATRRWLQSDPANVFTLVVDELHMYRGTAGSEVAYLLRNLFGRLGLKQDSGQVQVLAASASLDTDRSGQYLEEFFGFPPHTFAVVAGQSAPPPPHAGPLDEVVDSGEALAGVLTDALEDGRAHDALVDAARASDGRPRPRAISHLAERLFPNVQLGAAKVALNALLALGLSQLETRFPKVRAHMFFRSIQGFWACSDPGCSAVADQYRSAERSVGKLFAVPRLRCDCGSRVLELLYCQACGDLYLGGYSILEPSVESSPRKLLFPDFPDLDELPDRAVSGKTASNYCVYWPRTDEVSSRETWNVAKNGLGFAYRRARFDYGLGAVKTSAIESTGWLFEVAQTGALEDLEVPPFPTQCANCGTDWEMRSVKADDTQRYRSPVRAMRTGFEKITQVLTDSLLRQLGDEPKLVVFSDSRQDAAKLSAGIELRHYQDLARQLIVQVTTENPWSDLGGFEATERGVRTDEARGAWQRFNDRFPDEAQALSQSIRGLATPDVERLADDARMRAGTGAMPMDAIVRDVFDRIAGLGTNPAGTDFRFQTWGSDRKPWLDLFDWESTPVRARLMGAEAPEGTDALGRMRGAVRELCLEAIFAGAGRDLESLGLARATLESRQLAVPTGLEPDEFEGVLSACLVILGTARRFLLRHNGSERPPKRLNRYLHAVAEHKGIDPGTLTDSVIRTWGGAMIDFVVDPSKISLLSAASFRTACGTCRRTHLSRAPICAACLAPLTGRPIVEPKADYYAFLATDAGPPARLHCEELTGQTDRVDSQERQARFQGIFLGNENPRVSGVDLLSVTTTMEAGVDIGALRAVLMSNMPPMRFNYQQRVGRAGRRSDRLSVALTICRGRTHDDYYFARPDRITGDPPPPPYLDMSRPEIASRVLVAEVLRRALWNLGANPDDPDPGENIHGEFGRIADWPAIRAALERWVAGSEAEIRALVKELTNHTPLATDDARQDLFEFLTNLPVLIEQAGIAASDVGDLSQLLAERGWLPMFGFPSGVRYLYHQFPRRSFPWPPKGVIDRDLPLAITQFAPGGEIVKDKLVHTATGIADWVPQPPSPREVDDPMGPAEKLGVCRTCLQVGQETGDICQVCGESAPRFRTLDVAYPAGFTTNFQPRSFDGTFEWSGAAASLRLLPKPGEFSEMKSGFAFVRGVRSEIYAINDNRGDDYRFARAAGHPGWISADLVDDARQRAHLRLPPYDATTLRSVALGAKFVTDTLLLSLAHLPGLDMDPRETARKACWYSFGFLLREAAIRTLDVQSQELRVGVHARLLSGIPTGEVFLADALENGAGYCTHLARESVFPRLIDEVVNYVGDLLEAPAHSSQCTTSCYDCLRSYENMAHHPLLDWRLASDMVRILRHGELDTERWRSQELDGANDIARDHGGEVVQAGDTMAISLRSRLIIICHPLEATDAHMGPRLASATAFAEREVGRENVRYATSFDVLRRPSWVVANCLRS